MVFSVVMSALSALFRRVHRAVLRGLLIATFVALVLLHPYPLFYPPSRVRIEPIYKKKQSTKRPRGLNTKGAF